MSGEREGMNTPAGIALHLREVARDLLEQAKVLDGLDYRVTRMRHVERRPIVIEDDTEAPPPSADGGAAKGEG